MLGSSAASLVQARTELGAVLAAATPDEAPLKVAAELFALVDALDADKALARALTNPNRSAAPKRALVRGAMAGHMPAATELVATVAAARWSREGDLADALEQLGFDAAIAAARSDQGLRRTEEELFGVDVVLRGSRPLRTALADAVAPPAARAKLARDVFGDAVGPVT
ncbi:MAG: hypothetical protein LBD97_10725, partial [Bifidobacteriaceae bacterium]|nr:hypothetical protein [Bifidobacteriaceae bacterium]